MAEELDPHGLTPLEFNLLRTCMEREECTATELAEELPVDASRISRIVTVLVDKDLLVRRRLRSDRRMVMLRLSDEGKELTSMLLERIQAYDAKLTQNISPEEMKVFAEAAAKIIANHADQERQ
jgi:DNA-binding MarR family transcriptional regulator